MQTKVGIRELKAQLSAYLRHVKGGATVIVTERGKPIGRIVPISQPTQEKLEALSQAGLIAWSGQRLQSLAPVTQAKGDRTVADLLMENRE
jgi:prevent-host-death family protein